MMDDISIHGTTQEEHDERLGKVLQCLKELGTILNSEEYHFAQSSVKLTFLGHVLDSSGIKPDPSKVSTILDMPPTGNVEGVRQLLGKVN